MSRHPNLIHSWQIGPPTSAGVEAHIFGVGPNLKTTHDWRLYGPDGFIVHPHHAGAIKHINGSKAQGITKILCPDPTAFTGDLTQASHLTGLVEMNGLCFYHGAQAAGLELGRGEAIAISSGDCPTSAIYSKKTQRTFVCHFGLGELLPLKAIRGEPPDRDHRSVIDKIMERFADENPRDLEVAVLCGIGPKNFTHPINHDDPRWAEKNRRLIDHLEERYPGVVANRNEGQIDLFALISVQFKSYNLNPDRQIWSDSLETYGDPSLYSHRRWMKEGQKGPDKRNWVVVARNKK